MACAGSSGGHGPPHGNAFRLPADCEDDPLVDINGEEVEEDLPVPRVSGKKKQGQRGIAKGYKFADLKAQLGGGPVPLQWDAHYPNVSVPVGRHSQYYKSELGKFTRSRCKPYIPTWEDVDDQVKELIWQDMKANFRPVYKELVKNDAGVIFRKWKSRMKGDAINSTVMPPPKPANVVLDEDWELFLKRIEDPVFQQKCNKNAQNRNKQKYPCLQGRMPMASHRVKNKKDSITTWGDKHTRKDGTYVNEAANIDHNKLKEAKAKLAPGDQQLNLIQEKQVFQQVLGQRPDYIIGLGPTQPQQALRASQPSQYETGESSRAVLQKVDRLEKENKQIKKKQSKLKTIISTLLSFAKKNKDFPDINLVDSSDEENGDNNNDVEELDDDN